MKILSTILSDSCFQDAPPVLVDIGASGEINAKWKPIAPYCVCVAFDADDREFQVQSTTGQGYRSLITVNRIVTAQPVDQAPFHLTASPFCSSLLQPNQAALAPWRFHDWFEVTRTVNLPATTLTEALAKAGCGRVDWFKTDTQGTDLRLFLSLPESMRAGVLAAEFEPGIMDAYEGEDKLSAVLSTLSSSGFWLSSMEVKGTQRLPDTYNRRLGEFKAHRMVRRSPGWAELTYLRQTAPADRRAQLLLVVFALLERQYGFALECCDVAPASDPLWQQIRKAVEQKLNQEQWKIPLVMLKKQLTKLLAHVNA
jgi:hypothetical protein